MFNIALIIFIIGGIAIVVMAFITSKKMVLRIRRADKGKETMNQQIVETGKMASIGELAAGIAHEINNPVAIMVEEAGWIGDLLEEDAGPDVAEPVVDVSTPHQHEVESGSSLGSKRQVHSAHRKILTLRDGQILKTEVVLSARLLKLGRGVVVGDVGPHAVVQHAAA